MWYATSDAPAPNGETLGRRGVAVTIGVRPHHPANSVRVHYRIDGRGVRTERALLLRPNLQSESQYFRVEFPPFWTGEVIEYLPVANQGGRQVPDARVASTFPTSFRVEGPLSPLYQNATLLLPATESASYSVSAEHLMHVHVPIAPEPEVIGQTPAGFIVNWPPVGGTLDGSDFHARVVPGGEHQAIVRTDGTAILTASVTIATEDGALIEVHHNGVVDYGEGWADNLRTGRWPPRLPVRKGTRFLTASPKYAWLNRLQCICVGDVRPLERLYVYDVYAMR